jgi:hypothetical protein
MLRKTIIIIVMIFGIISCKTVSGDRSKSDSSPLELSPSVDNPNDSTIVFIINAKRNSNVEGEYIPSSEYLIVNVFDKSGKHIWSSSRGKAFMQVITPVLPVEIDSTFPYTLEWDGRANDDQIIPTGEYMANMMIPAKPKAYSTSINFNWKTK